MKNKRMKEKKLNFKRTRRVTQKNLCLSWEMSRSNDGRILDDNGIDGEKERKCHEKKIKKCNFNICYSIHKLLHLI